MLGNNRYGKSNVRFLRVVKDTPRHEAHEFTGQILLHGDFSKAFTNADNSSILPTETQKNTMYALSKKYPIDPVERWVVLAARDIMARHKHITSVDMEMVRTPWERVVVDGKQHNHCFLRASDGEHFVRAQGITRTGPVKLVSGFKNLRVMKTTQSGFEGYIVDQYTTLPPTSDRIMCTNVLCEYTFSEGVPLDTTPFAAIAAEVKRMTVEKFSGPADTGVYSASVQQTIHQIGTAVLARFAVLQSIKFVLPNLHFYPVDFAAFKDPSITNKGEVFLTFDGAAGHIEAEITRNPSKL